MKRRLRWLQIAGEDSDVRGLARQLVAVEYSERSGHGFIVQDANQQYVRAAFVEKIKVEHSFEDPWGVPQTSTQVEYRRVQFVFGLKNGYLELHDPPRTTSSLLETFLEISNRKIAIARPEANVANWIGLVEKKVRRAQVTCLVIANAPLAVDVRATVTMRGERDVRPEAERWLRKGVASIESAEIAWRTGRGDEWVRCDLSSRGACFEAHADSEVGSLLRETFFAAQG
jgi:hypothetical protein